MYRKLSVLCFTALLIAGCGRDTPEETADAAAMLELVPADTPYLLANLQTLPPETEESIWRMIEGYSGTVELALQSIIHETEETEEDNWARALAEEFSGRFSREGMEELGLNVNTTYAIYGLGPIPVIRSGLSDAQAFEAAIERVETRAQGSLPRGQFDGQEYYRFPLDNGLIVLAVVDGDLVASAMSRDVEEEVIAQVLGMEPPAEAYSTERLKSFNDEQGYLPYGSGFMDIRQLVDILLNDQSPATRALRDAVGIAPDSITPACNAEYLALADQMPRVTTGYTRIDGPVMTSEARLILHDDWSQLLTRVGQAPVTIDDDTDSLFNFGMALDLVALRDLARTAVDRLTANPPECETFAFVRENLEEWQVSVNRPIPPVVTNIHGFRVVLEELELDENNDVSHAAGVVGLYMRNPQLMFGMVEMFVPELAALEIRPGGEPKLVPPGMVPAPGAEDLDLYIVMTDNAIGVAISEAQADRLQGFLATGEGAGGTLLGFGYDVRAYVDVLRGVMDGQVMEPVREEGMSDEEYQQFLEEHHREVQEQLDAAMAMAETMKRSWSGIKLTPEGIRFEQTLELK